MQVELFTEYQRGKSLGEIMGRFSVEKKRGGVNSSFNDAVGRVKNTITDMDWSFGRWCGYLRNIPPYEIHSRLTTAEQSKNPEQSKNVGRHFLWLIKEYKKEQRNKQ